MRYDENHGPRRQPQSGGVGRFQAAGQADAKQGAERFDQATGGAQQRGTAGAEIDGAQCKGHSEPLRQVLQRDGDRRRQSDGQVVLGEADADRHAFGQVMQGNGENEQPDAGTACAVRTALPGGFVHVGRETIESEHQHDAERHAQNDDGCARCLAAEQGGAGLDAGQNQGEGAGGQHHAGRHAEHAVLKFL